MPAEAPVVVRELTGWGRTAPSAAGYVEPADRAALLAAVRESPVRGTVARGLGRSYGDPAQNAGGLVVGTRHLDRVVDLDLAAGTVTAEAGVPIGRLARLLLAHGLFVPVTPGTGAVTVGGAIAADVHGKNHHQDGSIGRHVERMTLALADGSLQVLTPRPDGDPELFWATLGGMGLTGIVVEATLRGIPVDTSWMSVDTCRAADLDGRSRGAGGRRPASLLGGLAGRHRDRGASRPRGRHRRRPCRCRTGLVVAAGGRRRAGKDPCSPMVATEAAQPLDGLRLQRGVVPRGAGRRHGQPQTPARSSTRSTG